MSLLSALEAHASQRPDAIALVEGDQRVSYGALWQQVQATAAQLRAEGIMPGERVALLLENSVPYVSGYYGALAAGAIVVPLNTSCRVSDWVHFLEHSGSKLLLAGSEAAELDRLIAALEGRVPVRAVGGTSPWCPQFQVQNPALAGSVVQQPNPDQPAAIIYTSGTTGRPKGVTLSHRNLVANVSAIVSYLGLGETDSIVTALPFYYSYGNSVLHTHLYAGGRLILERNMVYPHRLLELMAREKVSGFSGVPSTYSLLLSRTRLDQFDLSSLRYLTQAGGAMAPVLVERVLSQLPHVRFYVMYGQTEATARLAYLPPHQRQEKHGSVGVPIPGVSIEVRREDGSLAAPGEVGEIHARGDNIMLGYWRDEAATQAVIRDGWLNTGDLARCDGDGYIFIEGRRSDMLKSGAHRIAPLEIEEVLLQLEEIVEAAVYPIADEILGQVIGAAVVLKPGHALEAQRIQRHCRQRLSAYKVPKVVRFVEALPRTASGKVQRYLLIEASMPIETKGDKDVTATSQ